MTSTLADDPLFAAILPDYLAGLTGSARALACLTAADDRPAAGGLLHTLKGNGGSYGFDAITAGAGALERDVGASAGPIDADLRARIHAFAALLLQIGRAGTDADPATGPKGVGR